MFFRRSGWATSARLARSADGAVVPPGTGIDRHGSIGGRPSRRCWSGVADRPMARTGGGQPAAVAEPSAQCSVCRAGCPGDSRSCELRDDLRRILAACEPPFRLVPEGRPGVAARSSTRALARTDPGKMRPERPLATPGHRACRAPHRGQARDEVAPAATTLELETPMHRAQPNGHAVGQLVSRASPLPGPGADRAHRCLPDPRPLVVARRHRNDSRPPTRHTAHLNCANRVSSSCQLSPNWQPRRPAIGTPHGARMAMGRPAIERSGSAAQGRAGPG